MKILKSEIQTTSEFFSCIGSGENSSKLWVIIETFEIIVSNTGHLHLGRCDVLETTTCPRD
jgi:hypothetical protein